MDENERERTILETKLDFLGENCPKGNHHQCPSLHSIIIKLNGFENAY